jgi:hypothetical protein
MAVPFCRSSDIAVFKGYGLVANFSVRYHTNLIHVDHEEGAGRLQQ